MALFLSTYVNKIDKKGRVSMPAGFRPALDKVDGGGCVLFRSYAVSAIEGCRMDRLEALCEKMDGLNLFDETTDALKEVIFADAYPVNIDKDGRLLLPQSFVEHANIQDKVAFVGRGQTFQLWNPDIFQRRQEKAREKLRTEKISLSLGPRGAS